jgi:cytochrome c oxidase subunit 2
MDACPGRLNQVSMFIKREGTFYGQCSEICGVQHGFMPIVVQAVSIEDYVKWVSVQTECKNWLANKLKSIDKSK